MGILSASCSFTRFKITEPVPKELWMEIPAKLRQFAFQDIDDIAEERGWGWTSFEDMLDGALPHRKKARTSLLRSVWTRAGFLLRS